MCYSVAMIGSITGIVSQKGLHSLMVEVHGVGYLIYVTSDTLLSAGLGSPITLLTHLAVREDALELYGFADAESLRLFELLIGVPGIGPKSALAILSLASPAALSRAVHDSDLAYLTKVSGIGKKSAEKIIVELRDKLTGDEGSGEGNATDTDVLEALRSLGYSLAEAREALKHIPAGEPETSERIREALRYLST